MRHNDGLSKMSGASAIADDISPDKISGPRKNALLPGGSLWEPWETTTYQYNSWMMSKRHDCPPRSGMHRDEHVILRQAVYAAL